MKLATTTGDFTRFEKRHIDRVKHVVEAGFKYIDLDLYNLASGQDELSQDIWRDIVLELKEYTDKNGIKFVQAHGPNVNPLKEDFDTALAPVLRAIEICGILGIENMVMHPGFRKDASKDEWLETNKRFFHATLPALEKYNVNLLHENTSTINIPYIFPKTGEQMIEFSNYLNHPRFHSCWDTGHANMEGSQYDEILTIGDDLYALHINDNLGKKDEHTIPFLGTLNMDEVMNALKDIGYKGYFTFEVSSALRPLKYWLGDRKVFEKDTRLSEPSLYLQKELEKFIFSVGKYILEKYDMYEE